MKYTRFGDQLVMTVDSKKYTEMLFTTLDTTNNSYVASANWTTIDIEKKGSGADQKIRVLRLPQEAKITVPFNLGADKCKTILKGFFSSLTNLNLPSGVSAAQSFQDMEPIGSMPATVDSHVNLVDVPDDDSFDDKIDEDMTTNE